jgi:hypothetical protein
MSLFLLSMPAGPETLFILLVVLFIIWSLQDLLRSQIVSTANKVLWLLLILGVPLLGGIAYVLLGRKSRNLI